MFKTLIAISKHIKANLNICLEKKIAKLEQNLEKYFKIWRNFKN